MEPSNSCSQNHPATLFNNLCQEHKAFADSHNKMEYFEESLLDLISVDISVEIQGKELLQYRSRSSHPKDFSLKAEPTSGHFLKPRNTSIHPGHAPLKHNSPKAQETSNQLAASASAVANQQM